MAQCELTKTKFNNLSRINI